MEQLHLVFANAILDGDIDLLGTPRDQEDYEVLERVYE
jgi:hypothetical protein